MTEESKLDIKKYGTNLKNFPVDLNSLFKL
jgi:hypothetical protein